MSGAVLVTGAAARLGAQIARELARDGWAVCIHYNRSETRARAVADEIDGVAVAANLNVPAERRTVIDRASTVLGRPLTALINNASTFSPDDVGTYSDALFDHHVNTNLRAPLQLSKDFAAQLPKSETGVIINMIDQRVLSSHPDFLTYGLAKSALFSATRALAQSLAPHIRVCGIGPGPVMQSIHQTPEEFASEQRETLLGTGAPVEEIVRAVRYILSAKALTGQMLAIDGGQHLDFKRQLGNG